MEASVAMGKPTGIVKIDGSVLDKKMKEWIMIKTLKFETYLGSRKG